MCKDVSSPNVAVSSLPGSLSLRSSRRTDHFQEDSSIQANLGIRLDLHDVFLRERLYLDESARALVLCNVRARAVETVGQICR